jgi:hypothetical protein
MGDKTQEDLLFLRLSRKEWRRKRRPLKLQKELVKRLLFFVNLLVTLSERMLLSALGMAALNPRAYGRHGLVISIVEFILLLGSKKGMHLGDELTKTTVTETL